MKSNAIKSGASIMDVFGRVAGSVADAIALFEKYEEQLKSIKKFAQSSSGIAKWRTDEILRRLRRVIVSDPENLLVIRKRWITGC